jgi:hypothetical protein
MTSRKIANPEQFRLNIRGKLNEIIENEKHSTNLEKGIAHLEKIHAPKQQQGISINS